MTNVLVTDGDERAALACVRSLGRAGYIVYVCSRNGRSLAGASRFAQADFAVGDPLAGPESFVANVRSLLRKCEIKVLIPVSEAALRCLLPRREAFPHVVLPFASIERFALVSDKLEVTRAAAQLGIATPTIAVLYQPDDRIPDAASEAAFPLVVKPARSVVPGNEWRRFSVSYVRTVAELDRVVDALPASAFPVLLQRRVEGWGVGIFLLLGDHQEVLAEFSHRRIREKPPSGGVSVYRESIEMDPTLRSQSEALLRHFGWSGVAMVEFKYDACGHVPYLMEVNGRLWGSLQLAIDSGVDFPLLLVRPALGASDYCRVSTYAVRRRCRWLWGDIDHLVARLRRSRRELALPAHAPGRFRALLDFLVIWRPGDRFEVLRLSDLGPFLRETWQWFWNCRRLGAGLR